MSEPYVIEAKDFDPEKHEQPLAHVSPDACGVVGHPKYKTGDGWFVVKDKPKPPTLEKVIAVALQRVFEMRDPKVEDCVSFVASDIRAAGLANEPKQ